MKKTIFFVLAIGALISVMGAGCGKTATNTNTASGTNAAANTAVATNITVKNVNSSSVNANTVTSNVNSSTVSNTNTLKTNTNTTTDETASWKTYTSSNWKYSIKYPATLYTKSGNIQGSATIGAMDFIVSDIEKMGIQDVMPTEKIHVTVTTSTKTSDQTLSQYLVKQGVKESDMIEITLNGVKSYKIQSSASQPSTSIYTVNNNTVYHLYGINYLNESPNSVNYQQMEKIINTFTFTK